MESTKCSIVGCKKIAKTRGYCEMHYMRVVRHGTPEQTRPKDWGSREKHPLYQTWITLRRFKRDIVCEEWIGDFWKFAQAVKRKPSTKARCEFYPKDDTKLIGPGNWTWLVCKDRIKSKSKADYMRQWHAIRRKRDPFFEKKRDLKKHYGVTLDWYHEQLEKQNHLCAICHQAESVENNGRRFALAVDHCHDTKQVRGLLCMSCNRGIGFFRHDPKRLMAAISYLDAFPVR